MAETTRTGPTTGSQWDHVARSLQEWRRRAGEPSFTEIAARITRARVADGTPPDAARVGRTTVYDAFRLGRSRINLSLVREIGAALGADRGEVERLLAEPAGGTRPAPREDPAQPTEQASEQAPEQTPVDAAPDAGVLGAIGPALVLMVACVAANLLGRVFVDLLNLPVYLDMVGTALAAIVLGPWRGAAVGAATNLVGVLTTGVVSLPFMVVNVVGALVWGYGVHRFGMGRTLSRFFALTLLAALACTAVSVPILYWMFDGSIGHGQDTVTANLYDLTHQLEVSIVISNLLTSTADKVISAFAALVAASMLGVGTAGVAAERRTTDDAA